MHKSTSSAREKPSKVNVDDEGRSGVRSGSGLTPGVEEESRPEEERMKQTEYGEREPLESSLRRVNRQTGGTRRHLSAVAMKALTSGHNSKQVTRSTLNGSSDDLVGGKVKIQTGVNTV